MQIKNYRLQDIHPYEKNPRRLKNAVKAVAESIRQFGFRQPIVVDKDGAIVCGHTRYHAAKRLKMTEVPCVLADDLSPDAVRAYRILDNRLNQLSEWDCEALARELTELQFDFAPFDVDFSFAFANDEQKEDEENSTVVGESSPSEPPAFEPIVAPDSLPASWQIVVDCESEERQAALHERLVAEGYKVRLCNL